MTEFRRMELAYDRMAFFYYFDSDNSDHKRGVTVCLSFKSSNSESAFFNEDELDLLIETLVRAKMKLSGQDVNLSG